MNSYINSLLVALSIFASTAQAADTVIINVDAGNPPFMFSNQGDAEGIYPAIFYEAFRRMGVSVNIIAMPWKKAVKEAEEGKGAIGDFYQTPERLLKFDYSEFILLENFAVYYKRDSGFDFHKCKDLYGKRVGVMSGWSYGEEFDNAVKNKLITVDESLSDRQNFKKLQQGKIDVVIAVNESGRAIIHNDKIPNITRAQPYLIYNRGYLAFAKSANQTALLSKFSSTIAAMRSDGTLDAIVLRELSK